MDAFIQDQVQTVAASNSMPPSKPRKRSQPSEPAADHAKTEIKAEDGAEPPMKKARKPQNRQGRDQSSRPKQDRTGRKQIRPPRDRSSRPPQISNRSGRVQFMSIAQE